MPPKNPLEVLPRFLREWPYWAAWSKPNRDAKRRPLDLRRALAPASTSARSPTGINVDYLKTWASYEHAAAHLEMLAPTTPYKPPVPVGCGILIDHRPGANDRLAFIDFDDILDDKGNAPDWAVQFINAAKDLGAYVEFSGSGEGAHVIMRVPREMTLTRNRYTRQHPTSSPCGIEIYVKERFAALTGLPIGKHRHKDDLNELLAGVLLIRSFIDELDTHGAPILLAELPPTPRKLPPPSEKITAAAHKAMTPLIKAAFDDPALAFEMWGNERRPRGQDQSLSAWRFCLFLEACRASIESPLPVYELFNPDDEPVHPGVIDWQEFSGHSKKFHRRYADIQRAHAMVAQEIALFVQSEEMSKDVPEIERPTGFDESLLISPPAQMVPLVPEVVAHDGPQPAYYESRIPNSALAPIKTEDDNPTGFEIILSDNPSWAELGLVMKMGKAGAFPLTSSVNIIRLLTRHPYFKEKRIERNLLTGVTMINRIPLPDTQITRWQEPLRSFLNMDNDPSPEAVRAAVEVVADDNAYDPLVEHIDALPQWSPPPEYDADSSLLSTWLEQVGATLTADTRRFSRRIILALIARALDPGVKFDNVFVLEGREGLGKSTLVKSLVTAEFYCTLGGDLRNKDAKITLRGHWGVEMPELSAFKKSDSEAQKDFFSNDTDSFRAPYERANRDIKRRTVLFGTVNPASVNGYLSDINGINRRYLPIRFKKEIDIPWFLAHRDEIFAEGLYWYRQQERFYELESEYTAPERQKLLQARMVTPAWQIKLIQHLQSLPKPHLASNDNMGASGILTPAYVAGLQETLKLPQTVMHMGANTLAVFLKRAGYQSIHLNYRPQDKGTPRKLAVWGHPALKRLSNQQLYAFLACYPDIFPNSEAPPGWVMLQAEHLEPALLELESAPDFDTVDFSGDDDD